MTDMVAIDDSNTLRSASKLGLAMKTLKRRSP